MHMRQEEPADITPTPITSSRIACISSVPQKTRVNHTANPRFVNFSSLIVIFFLTSHLLCIKPQLPHGASNNDNTSIGDTVPLWRC